MRFFPKSNLVPLTLQQAQPPQDPASVQSSVYATKDVKQQLLTDQHHKCCYCGCNLNGDFGDVEHYRPKMGYALKNNPDGLHKPGYYWLAYDWNNLLLSCSCCNRSFKKNFFDLKVESARNIEGKDISHEEPLLVNPSTEDPSAFIGFHDFMAYPKVINGAESDRGQYTIRLLGLNTRQDLVDCRSRVWDKWQTWNKIMKVGQSLLKKGLTAEGEELLQYAQREIKTMKSPESEYSEMFV